MKRFICIILAVSAMCCISGCRNGGNGAALAVPDASYIESALRQAGLPGSVSESETFFTAGGSVCYSIRDPDQNDRLTIAITSSDIEGKRFLQLMYFSPPIEQRPSFTWEDWKKQFELAELLAGGALDADELYLTFSKMTPSISVSDDSSVLAPVESFQLDAQLSPQYGVVWYSLLNSSVEHSFPSAKVLAYSQRLVIYIFESEADYNNIRKETKMEK